MIKISIKNRWTGSIKFEYESKNNTIRKTVLEMIRIATLEDKDADLTDADLTDADLTDANLTDANLTDANLTRANLTDANLTRANLTDANLTDANLTDANLTRANLTRANLTDANLTRANLEIFKHDLWATLIKAQAEIPALKQSVIDGKINGSQYEGSCACLKGTIANIRHCKYDNLPGLTPDSSSPSERWFMQLKEGLTPENSGVAKLTVEWIEEFEHWLNKPIS